ncbi:MAG: stage II sporulation protein M [Chloroflexi bacterium]|nr:stage II sporulation protein M [Chloroflexota bacterium]
MISGLSLVIARREVKDAFTDSRILLPMLILAVIFPALVVAGIAIGMPLMEQVDPEATTGKLIPFGAMLVGFFPISFSLVIALESFVGEKERNTLEALLAMPLSDAELFAGKLLAVLVPPLILSLVALAIYTACLRLFLGFQVASDILVLTVMLSSVEAFVMVAGAVVISSHTTSVRAANLLASFVVLPVALALQGELILLITGYGQALWFVWAEFLVIAIILVRMGITVFNREAILARENDQLNARLVLGKLWRFFNSLPDAATDPEQGKGGRFGLRRLYIADMPQLLMANWQPTLVVVCLVGAGAVIGYVFATQHPVPLGLRLAPDLARYSGFLDSLGEISTWSIFIHNLRALAIAAFLSVFSFGAAALLLLLMPLVLVGFFTGQASAMGLNPAVFAFAFFVPHGIIELPVAVLVSAFSLRLGMSLMSPPKGFTFGDSLLLAIANWVKVMIALLPFLLVAAFVEAEVTPLVVRWLLGSQ